MSERIDLNNFKVITDKLNTYFKDNQFMVGSSIPNVGTYKVGDIIVNNGNNATEIPMWICTKAGTPGTWEVFNSGGMEETELENYITNIVQSQAISAVDYTDGMDIQIDGRDYSSDIGQLNNLQTLNKDNLVAAINELFQSANNGKQLIASAIGEPLSATNTFTAMSNDINGLLSTFKTNMMNNGVTVESSDKFKALIDKINDVSNIKKQDIVDILTEKGVDANNTETWEEILSKLEVLKNPVPALSYNTWTESPNMTVARYNPAAIAHENDIYAIGGYNSVESNANEKYDTLTGTWTTKTNAPNGLGYAAGANVGNTIYCFSYNQIYAYDTTSNTWSTKAKINATYGIYGCKMFNYNDNIYIYGEQYNYGNAMYKYDPVKNTVTEITPEYQYKYEKNPLGFVLINGYIYAPGGYYIDDEHHAQNTPAIYTISPETAEYGYVSAGLGSYCHYESLVGFGINEKAYFCGGFYCSDYSDTDEISLKVWCLDTYQCTMTNVADLPYFVYDSGSTSLNGVGYLIGGRTDYSTCSNKMIIYKP